MNFIWENIFKKNKESDIHTILSENILFRDLTPREIRFVNNIVHVRRFHPNEMIFRQGEAGVGMYIIMKGRVEIFITDENAPSPEFQNIFITQLLAADFFGELSLVEDGSHRAASAIAREETTLIGFFRPDLMEILSRSPSTGVKIVFRLAEVLGRRLKETTNKVSELRAALKELRVPPPLSSGTSGASQDSTNEYASKY
jgi:CRP-like cAMP-binding protein